MAPWMETARSGAEGLICRAAGRERRVILTGLGVCKSKRDRKREFRWVRKFTYYLR